MDDHRRLAALAVFRELYDNRKNLYDILREFIIETIASQRLHSFTADTLRTKIEEIFGLRVPRPVLKTVVNNLSNTVDWCSKLKGEYIVDGMPTDIASEIERRYEIRQDINRNIFDQLVLYINKHRETQLNDDETKEVLDSLCIFLLNEKNGEAYSDYISSFVIENESNDQFQRELNEIREGVVLYSGITFNDPQTNTGKWKDELTLFLDQEILFNCYGLNGDLFRSYFDEFNKFVIEINTSANRKIVRLRYFPETRDDVDAFFSYAERVVRGEVPIRPGNTAMQFIVNGCNSASDVREKRTALYYYLDTIGIRLDDSFVFDQSTYPNNILSSTVYETLLNEVWEVESLEEGDMKDRVKQKAHCALSILNKIHCLRGSAHSTKFYAVKYHFLTGTAKTLESAWHESIKGEETIPLAINMDSMVNKFWFKLNKGFQGEAFPASSQVLYKARMVLSTVVNRSVGEQYDALVAQFKRGELPTELVQAKIVDLMSHTVRPEDVDAQSVDSVLDIIQRDSLEHFKAEQEASMLRQKKTEEENERLRQAIIQKNQEASTWKSAMERSEDERKLDKLTVEISQLEDIKNKADRWCSALFGAVYIALALVVAFFTWIIASYVVTHDWNSLEPKLFLIQIASAACMFLLTIAVSKPLTPGKIRELAKAFIKKKIYVTHGVCEDQICRLREQARFLKKD